LYGFDISFRTSYYSGLFRAKSTGDTGIISLWAMSYAVKNLAYFGFIWTENIKSGGAKIPAKVNLIKNLNLVVER